MKETHLKLLEEAIIKPMDITKEIVSLFLRLRKECGIPLRQPILDFAFTGKYVMKGYIQIIGEAVNVCPFHGKKFSDKDWYTGYDIDIPKEYNWKSITVNGISVAINTSIPNWLLEKGQERKKEREEIVKRKKSELAYG